MAKVEGLPNLPSREARRTGAVLGLETDDSLGALHAAPYLSLAQVHNTL